MSLSGNINVIINHTFFLNECGFYFKIAGALAEKGCPLEEIVARVNEATKNIGEKGEHSTIWVV